MIVNSVDHRVRLCQASGHREVPYGLNSGMDLDLQRRTPASPRWTVARDRTDKGVPARRAEVGFLLLQCKGVDKAVHREPSSRRTMDIKLAACEAGTEPRIASIP